MGFLKKAEELLFTGKVIKDYGIVGEFKKSGGTYQHTVLLTEKKGQTGVIIKEKIAAMMSARVSYFEFDRESVLRLKEALEDALQMMDENLTVPSE